MFRFIWSSVLVDQVVLASAAIMVDMVDLVNFVVLVIAGHSIIVRATTRIGIWADFNLCLLMTCCGVVIAYRHHHHHLHSHHLWSSPSPTYRRNPQWASLLLWWFLLTCQRTSRAEPGYKSSKSVSTSVCSVTSRMRLALVAIPSGFWRQTTARNAGLAKLSENRATRIKKSSEALHGCICVRSAL